MSDSAPAPSEAVLRQAAEWFAVLRSDDVGNAEGERFERWWRSNPEHRRAWAAVEAIEGRLSSLPRGPAKSALTAAALDRRQALKAIAAIGIGVPAAWAGSRLVPLDAWRADYHTAVGEVREIALADGTRVWLNTDSALDVDYSTERRRLTLVRGEVLVETAPDRSGRSRPFAVATAFGTLRPVGTRFSVRERGDSAEVEVFAGAVEIDRAGSPAHTVSAGERARLAGTRIQPLRAGHSDVPAWTRGMLVTDNMRLADFVAELARYHHGYIGCSAGAADLRIVGAFPLDDLDRVLAALEQSLPVRVHRFTPLVTRIDKI